MKKLLFCLLVACYLSASEKQLTFKTHAKSSKKIQLKRSKSFNDLREIQKTEIIDIESQAQIPVENKPKRKRISSDARVKIACLTAITTTVGFIVTLAVNLTQSQNGCPQQGT